MIPLRQSTAAQTFSIGSFVDDTDFKTVENVLSIANTDIKLKKNGATAVNKNSGGATSDVNGMYAITLDATDTDTVGKLQGSVLVTGALVVWFDCYVFEEAVYDLMYPAAATGVVTVGTNNDKTGYALSTAGDQSIADLILPATNTAYSNIPFFMVNETDHVTGETGLTVTATRSIDGGASFGAATGSVSEIANGAYSFDASAADVNGKQILLKFSSAGADDSFVNLVTSL